MDTPEPRSQFAIICMPFALIALALCVFFFGQIKGVGGMTVEDEDAEPEQELETGTKAAMEVLLWQGSSADKQIALLKDSREKLSKAIEERKPLVNQSEALQKGFTELMKDVNALAGSGDEDAKKIITGYGIKIADRPKEQ